MQLSTKKNHKILVCENIIKLFEYVQQQKTIKMQKTTNFLFIANRKALHLYF